MRNSFRLITSFRSCRASYSPPAWITGRNKVWWTPISIFKVIMVHSSINIYIYIYLKSLEKTLWLFVLLLLSNSSYTKPAETDCKFPLHIIMCFYKTTQVSGHISYELTLNFPVFKFYSILHEMPLMVLGLWTSVFEFITTFVYLYIFHLSLLGGYICNFMYLFREFTRKFLHPLCITV